MKKPLALAVFLFALTLAACGGGGGGSALPAAPTVPTAGKAPTSTGAQMVLHIPPASQQSKARHPFYISSATQSVGILIAPVSGATPSPAPAEQFFPIATPSPCQVASGGGYTCTFTVQAYYGNDSVTIYTYAVPNPNSSTVPLSIAQGTLTVTPGVASTPAPINATFNAIIAKVSVSVPSPDPSNTPNTQVFTAGVAASSVPLTINAYDASGNSVLSDPTSPFGSAVTVSLPSANGGFSLQINPTCASGSGTAANGVAIGCAADLSKVTLAYNGSTSVDSSDHIIDNVAITPAIGATNATGTDVGYAVLQSNIVTYPLGFSTGNITVAQLQDLSDGTVAFLVAQNSSWGMGIFNPSTGTITGPSNSTTGSPQAFAVSKDMTSIWIADQSATSLSCWTSTAATSGAPAATRSITAPIGYPIRVNSIAFDGAGNLWYEGVDQSVSGNWAGYIPVTANCGAPATAPRAQVALAGVTGDYHAYMAGTSNGAVWASGNAGIYTFNTTTVSASGIAPASGTSPYGGNSGVGVDAASTAYFVNNFNDLSTYNSDVEKLASGSSTPVSIRALPPGTAGVIGFHASAQTMDVFSTGGSGDRLTYIDGSLGALGLVDELQSTPSAQLIALPTTISASGFTPTGEPLAIGYDNVGHPTLARVLATRTWNVPVSSYVNPCSGVLLSVLQRGNGSGPFTIGASGGLTVNAFPGANSSEVMLTGSSAPSFTITVTDASGRKRTFPGSYIRNSCP